MGLTTKITISSKLKLKLENCYMRAKANMILFINILIDNLVCFSLVMHGDTCITTELSTLYTEV